MQTEPKYAEQKIPRWILIISGFLGLLAAFVGLSLYFSPATFITNVDFSVPGHRNLVLMWATRQVSIAVVIIVSLFLRRAEMLWIALLAYGLMTLQDAVVGLSVSDTGLAFGSAFFFGLSALLLWKTWKFVFPFTGHNQ